MTAYGTSLPADQQLQRDHPQPWGALDEREDIESRPGDDAEIFRKLKRWFRIDAAASSEWREECESMFSFASGYQWADEDKRLLADQGRPAITFNKSDPVIDRVSGAEIGNRQDIVALPREMGDVKPAETATAALDWARDGAMAAMEESDAFRDLIICGMGWLGYHMDYLEEARGDLRAHRVPPEEMYWDAHAIGRNLRDARRIFRAKEVALEEAQAMFPDVDKRMLDAALWAGVGKNAPGDRSTKVDRSARDFTAGSRNWDDMDPQDPSVVLIEAQWWERETVAVVTDLMTGETQEMPPGRTSILKSAPGRYQVSKRQRKVWKRALLGNQILSMGDLQPEGWHYVCMTGKRDPRIGGWYGMVRAMADPQRWANKWLAQIMYILNSQGKGGVLVEEGAVVDEDKAQRDWAKPTAWITMARNALSEGRFAEKPVGQVPPDLYQLLPVAMNAIRECAGVNLELLGQVAREQAGVLEYQRKQEGMAMLSVYFDSLSLLRQDSGRLCFRFIASFMADGRLIRVSSEENRKYIPLILDRDVHDYDIVVNESPTAPNQKERTWQLLQPMLPVIANLGLPAEAWLEIVRYSPLPSTLADKLAEIMSQQGGPTPEQDLALEQMRAEVESEVAKALKDRAAAQKALAEAGNADVAFDLDVLKSAAEVLKAGEQPQQGKPNGSATGNGRAA